MEARASTLTIEATDLETTVCRRIGGVEVLEEGAAAIPAKALTKATGSATEDEMSIETEPNRGVVRFGARSVTLASPGTEDWPAHATVTTKDPSILAGAEQLGEALARASLCASKDESRPALTSIALQFEEGSTSLQIVASDSFRLGALEVPLVGRSPVSELVLIPARTIRRAATQMRKGGGSVVVSLHDGGQDVTFDHAATTWTIRRIQGEFPNWREIIPPQSGPSVALDAVEVSAALKTVCAVRSAPGVPVRLHFGASCSLTLTEHDGAEVSETLQNTTLRSGKEIDVAFNPEYLADALRFVGSDSVEVNLQDGLKPSVFGTPDRRYVLMPVRI